MKVDARIVADWISLQSVAQGTAEFELLFPAWESVYDMTLDRPEEAWQFILAVLAIDTSNKIMENLSAGPLEDLLSKHGDAFIDRVEAEARANPMFANLLGGVWQNDISEPLWRRIQAVWDRRGWDGIPAA